MKLALLSGRTNHLLRQRNGLLSLSLALLALNGLQALLLFFRDERVVVVPPYIHSEFWVSQTQVSASYLEEMAISYAGLLLERSPESAAYKRDLILRHTVASAYGALKAQLTEEERLLGRDRVTTSFQPNTTRVNAKALTVEVTGDLSRFVGEKRITQSRDTYVFTFVYRHGRLLIQSFQLLKSESHA